MKAAFAVFNLSETVGADGSLNHWLNGVSACIDGVKPFSGGSVLISNDR